VNTHTAVVAAHGISKTFGARKVLSNVSLSVLPQEVHALLGQNGSGKSTLIKILAGYHRPDPAMGQAQPPHLLVRGDEVKLPLTTRQADQLGLAFVHQDLANVLSATVLENLRIGRFEVGRGWRIRWRDERTRARQTLEMFGLGVSPDRLVSSLSVIERAMLAILRGFARLPEDRSGMLVLDEPTAYLPRDGVEQVFSAIRSVAQAGHGVLFVTHRLEEAVAITDRISVLRDGQVVLETNSGATNERALVRAILGSDLADFYPERAERTGAEVVSVRRLGGARLTNLDLSFNRGEIVGLTGLIGAGYEEVPYLIFGASRGTGEITVGGRVLPQHTVSPRAAIREGIAFLPADRRQHGAVAKASVSENATLPTIGKYYDQGLLRRRREERRVAELLDDFKVQPRLPRAPLGILSGGNQQKTLLGKWFEAKPKLLMLHEPTQGVDVGAKQAIFRILRDAAANDGIAVVLASAEYEDLANLCHRVVVFRNGRAAAVLEGAALTHERVVQQCMVRDAGTAA
jgi:ribose transport system ATP-binding protein